MSNILKSYIELSSKNIELELLAEMANVINKAVLSSIKDMEREIKDLTRNLMLNSRFYSEIMFGRLAGHMGIPISRTSIVVREIINGIVDDIGLVFTPFKAVGYNLTSGFELGIGRNGFAALINMSAGKVLTEKFQMLDWLKWMLTQGDKIIISGYSIRLEYGKGRSKQAVMSKTGRTWRVPPAFSGTITDNFISRTLLADLEKYAEIVFGILQRTLDG